MVASQAVDFYLRTGGSEREVSERPAAVGLEVVADVGRSVGSIRRQSILELKTPETDFWTTGLACK